MFYGNQYGEFEPEEQHLISSVEIPRRLDGRRQRATQATTPSDDGWEMASFFLILILTAGLIVVTVGSYQPHETTSVVSSSSQNTGALAPKGARPPQQSNAGEDPTTKIPVAPPSASLPQDQGTIASLRPAQVQEYLPTGWSPAVFSTDVQLWVREGSGWRKARVLPHGTEALVRRMEGEGLPDGWHAVVGTRGEFSGYSCLGKPIGPIPENASWPLPPTWRRAMFHGTREAVMFQLDGNWAFMISADGLTWGYARPTDFQPIPFGG